VKANIENECSTSYETLESTGEMKLVMKFCWCLHKFSELWNSFSLVPMRNCFWCYFRKLLMYLPSQKCKNDCKILQIILVPDFSQLKPEIAQFSTRCHHKPPTEMHLHLIMHNGMHLNINMLRKCRRSWSIIPLLRCKFYVQSLNITCIVDHHLINVW